MARSYALGGLIGLVALGAAEARAQTDLNAGMTPAQLFAANCAACHRSSQGLARGRDAATIANILRDHYTSRPTVATAIAGYLVGVRAPPRPAAGPAIPGGEQPVAPAPAPASAARTRPLDRLPNPTVERLKSFAADADAAKPSTPDAPARGVQRLLSYSSAGVAANSLREAAVGAPHCCAPERARAGASAGASDRAAARRRRSENGCKRSGRRGRCASARACGDESNAAVAGAAVEQRNAHDAVERGHALRGGDRAAAPAARTSAKGKRGRSSMRESRRE